jgi:hypothetical protein
MSTIYGTYGNDVIDATLSPSLTLIDGLAGDDYIKVGTFGNAMGGPGNDTIEGGAKVSGPGAVYWSSPKGIKVNFSTYKVEDGFGSIDTLNNIHTIQGSGFADTVVGGNAGDSFWASLNGDQVDGLTSQLVVTYWSIDPYQLKIEYLPENKEFRVSNPANPNVPADSLKNISGIAFNGNGYQLPLLTSSNIQDFTLFKTDSFIATQTGNFKKGDAGLITNSYISGDFNGDNFQDLAVFRLNWTQHPESPIQILLGDGHGSFKDGTDLVFNNKTYTTYFPARVLAADINNDGLDDLFSIDTGMDVPPAPGGQNQLYLSDGKGHLVDQTVKLPSEIAFNHGASVADVNNDGRLDILINALSSNVSTSLYLQDSKGQFVISDQFLPVTAIGRGVGLKTPFTSTWSGLIDLNVDGRQDLILGTWTPNEKTRFYFGEPTTLFQKSQLYTLPSSGVPLELVMQIVPIDLNGDALPDLALSITNGGDSSVYYHMTYIQLLINKGDGSFVDETQVRLPQTLTPSSTNGQWFKYLEVTDLNHDGKPDLVAIGDGSPGLVSYTNDGTGKFFKSYAAPLTLGYGSVGDFNNDGMTDFVIANSDASTVKTLINSQDNGHIYKANFGGEQLLGSAQADSFLPRNGKNIFNGNAGLDTLYISNQKNNYSVSTSSNQWVFVNKQQSTDQVISQNIERVSFFDTSIAIDLNGSAGTTAKILGAVFGKDSLVNKSYVGIGLHFLDAGWTYDNLAALALDAAGAKTNEQIVSLLWKNVIGTAANIGDKAPYMAMLENGMTPGALVHLAADAAFNTTNINLTGLALTGIEYTQ